MNWRKVFRLAFVTAATVIGLVALATLIIVISGVTLDLNFIRPAVERGAARALGRPVQISGPIELSPSLRPTVSIREVTIGNTSRWGQSDFMTVELARTQIDIPDLLSREIAIGEITAEGISLNLVSGATGQNNWDHPAGTTKDPEQPAEVEPTDPEPDGERKIRFMALDRLSLQRIVVHYRDEVLGKEVDFRIDDFSGSATQGAPIHFAIQGSLQGHPYSIIADGGTLAELYDKQSSWPLKGTGDVAGTPVEATGFLDRGGEDPVLQLGFALGKVDIGGLLAWLGLFENVDAATDRFAMEAKLVGDSLHELAARSELKISLEGGRWNLKDRNTQAALSIHIVDGAIRVVPNQPVSLKVNGEIDRTPVSFSVAGMPLADYLGGSEELRLHIAAEAAGTELRLAGKMRLPARARDASLELTLRGDSLSSLDQLLSVELPPLGPYRLSARFAVVASGYELSDLDVNVGESELKGSLKLDTSSKKPRVDLHLTSSRMQTTDFSFPDWSPLQPVIVEDEGSSPTVQEAIAEKAREDSPVTSLLSPKVLNAFDARVDIRATRVVSGSEDLGGGRLSLAVQDGRLSIDPIRLDVTEGYVQLGFSIWFEDLADGQQTRMSFTGKGASIDDLDEILHIDLPPFGPYSLQAGLSIRENGYELSDLEVKVGESHLKGRFALDRTGEKPTVAIDLLSERLQLTDFNVSGWSPVMKKVATEEPESGSDETAVKTEAPSPQNMASLLSPQVLNALDIQLNVTAKEVLFGMDSLGGGQLGLSLQNGRISVEPFFLAIPGGSVDLGFSIKPTETDTTAHLHANIDRFDIGVLIRRLDPGKKLGGLLSLKMVLDSTAPDFEQLMAKGNGYFDFAFWPENLRSGIVDLWAVNLIQVLSEKVDDEPNSTLNCAVARFYMDDGLVRERAIFLDTTRMSVNGDASIDFKSETIDVLAAPRAKQPEFFSLATPVKIHGTFSDFGLGINKVSLAKSVVSFITSPITVPFRRLFSGKVPADGKVACEQAWKRVLSAKQVAGDQR